MEPEASGPRPKMAEGLKTDVSNRMNSDREKVTVDLLGMTLMEIELAEIRGDLCSLYGVAVLAVDPDSEPFMGGVRNGDIIVEVNDSKVRSLHDLKKVVLLHDPSKPIMVLLRNSHGWRLTSLCPGRTNPV